MTGVGREGGPQGELWEMIMSGGAKNEAKQVNEEWDTSGPQGSLVLVLVPKPLDLTCLSLLCPFRSWDIVTS